MCGPCAQASPSQPRSSAVGGRKWPTIRRCKRDRCTQPKTCRRISGVRRSRRTSHGHIKRSRQCHQVFHRKGGRRSQHRIARRRAHNSPRTRPRRWDSNRSAQTRLQTLSSRTTPEHFESERYRPGPVYRALDCARTRRESLCRKRRGKPGHNRHAGVTAERRMSRVLVVEDETHLADGLKFNLEAEGYSVQVVGDGESAIDQLLKSNEKFDAVVLDVMLPGIDGFGVASALRKAKNYVPVLMLTARGRPEDVLEGFAAGADDYLPKPFQLPIFLARLQGLLRRSGWLSGTNSEAEKKSAAQKTRSKSEGGSAADQLLFTFTGKTLDFDTLQLRTKTTTIQLTLMEAKLLRHLIKQNGRTVSRKSILEDVWDLREDTDTRAIDNFIVRLRRYIEDNPAKPRHLLTVRGVGYRFVA